MYHSKTQILLTILLAIGVVLMCYTTLGCTSPSVTTTNDNTETTGNSIADRYYNNPSSYQEASEDIHQMQDDSDYLQMDFSMKIETLETILKKLKTRGIIADYKYNGSIYPEKFDITLPDNTTTSVDVEPFGTSPISDWSPTRVL